MRRMIASCCQSFSPNSAMSGCTCPNSLATTVATPSKWPGRAAPSKCRSRPATPTVVAKPVRIHHLDRGQPQQVAAMSGEQRRVRRLLPRIARKILVRPELQRIDEDRGDHMIRQPSRLVDQRHMPGMQCAHRRHERHAPVHRRAGGAQIGQGADGLHGGGPSLMARAPNRSTEGPPPPMAHAIVFANEKGGTGKSTTAVHVAVALTAQGARVARSTSIIASRP